MAVAHLTEKSIQSLPVPARGQKVYYDDTTKNLAVIARSSGSRSFYLIKRIAGRLLYEKIGDHGLITLADARAAANRRKLEFANGLMPLKKDTTLRFAFRKWEEAARAKGNREKSIFDVTCRIKKHLPEQLLRRDINRIERAEIQELYNHLAASISHTTARHIVVYTAAAINTLVKLDYPIRSNPAKFITMKPPAQRERVLRRDELKRFIDAVEESESEIFKDFVKVALFTSKRRENVASMRWSHIDTAEWTWTIPKMQTKSKQTDLTALPREVVQILRRRRQEQREQRIATDFVFYSPASRIGYYREYKTAWKSVLKKAGIKDFRLHDLRRTIASYMANRSESLHMIAGVLGQKTTQATPVYARLSLESRRQALSGAIGDLIRDAEGISQNKAGEIGEMIAAIHADPQLALRMLDYYRGVKN